MREVHLEGSIVVGVAARGYSHLRATRKSEAAPRMRLDLTSPDDSSGRSKSAGE